MNTHELKDLIRYHRKRSSNIRSNRADFSGKNHIADAQKHDRWADGLEILSRNIQILNLTEKTDLLHVPAFGGQ
jgi:hypothetical protein